MARREGARHSQGNNARHRSASGERAATNLF